MKDMKKKGISWTQPAAVIGGFILLVVLFKLVAALYPTLTEAGEALNAANVPIVEGAFGNGGWGYYVVGGALILGLLVFIGIKMKNR